MLRAVCSEKLFVGKVAQNSLYINMKMTETPAVDRRIQSETFKRLQMEVRATAMAMYAMLRDLMGHDRNQHGMGLQSGHVYKYISEVDAGSADVYQLKTTRNRWSGKLPPCPQGGQKSALQSTKYYCHVIQLTCTIL